MSLENYIKIDYKLLPQVKNKNAEFFKNADWQTLSLNSCLADYVITENALLYFNHVNNKTEDVHFHGIIHFYNQDSEIKNEFKAKYTDGKLINISEVFDQESKHWKTR